MIRDFFGSAGTRILVLPLSGIASILIARAISGSLGAGDYAAFILVATLPLLFPFSDLGLGAALTNMASTLPGNNVEFRDAFFAILKRLTWVAFGLAFLALALGAMGLWPSLLGFQNSGGVNWGVASAMSMFALSIPTGMGARILVGLRRNMLVTVIQGLSTPVNLCLVLVVLYFSQSLGALIALSTVGPLISSCLLLLFSVRDWRVKEALESTASQSGKAVRADIWRTARPMLLLSIALPLTYQSERLVVSVLAGEGPLALYASATLLYFPALSVVQIATRSLWGQFARARALKIALMRPYILALSSSSALGFLGALAFIGVSGPVAHWAVHGTIDIPWQMTFVLAASIMVNALHLPGGMLLTDSDGLRAQATLAILACLLTLPTSIVLVRSYGAVGAPAASLIGLFLIQFLPCLWLVVRRIRLTGSSQP